MPQAVVINPAKTQRCYRFKVDDTIGARLLLPARCCSFAVFNDTGGTNLFIDVTGAIPTIPSGASSIHVVTPKILANGESPWAADLAVTALGFITNSATPIDVRVEAYFQLDH